MDNPLQVVVRSGAGRVLLTATSYTNPIDPSGPLWWSFSGPDIAGWGDAASLASRACCIRCDAPRARVEGVVDGPDGQPIPVSWELLENALPAWANWMKREGG